jgi:hypothetical protein
MSDPYSALRDQLDECLDREASLSRYEAELCELRQLLTESQEALQALVNHTSSGMQGGDMQQMATLEGRLKWYDGLMPIRDKARATLAKLQEASQ